LKQIRFDILLIYFWMFVFFGAGHGDSIVGAERSGIIMRGVLDVFSPMMFPKLMLGAPLLVFIFS